MHERGIRLPPLAWRSGSPEDALRHIGLVPVQARDTWRRPRTIVSPSGDSLAELVVDAVRYELVDRRVVH